MRSFIMAALLTSAAMPPLQEQAVAPQLLDRDASPIDRRTLGREQGDPWIPATMLAPGPNAKRRDLMLSHIRREVEARRSSIVIEEVDRVLVAMRTLNRERFVPKAQRRYAYFPVSVDIGHGQTLSDPYLVTVMLAAAHVRPGDHVLDVGTGSGFQAALLDRLGSRVTSIEIVPALADEAAARLRRLGFKRVAVATGDGALGYRPSAPFDVIIVAAGATDFPAELIGQLAPGGRLIMPIGPTQATERLLLASRSADGSIGVCSLGLAAAVPLTGGGAAGLSRSASDTPSPCFRTSVT